MLEPVLCGPLARAPLLPKLRGHFAEFLNNASSAGLGLLAPSTCVGLRYGCGANDSGFSRHAPRALPYLISVVSRRVLPAPVFPGARTFRFPRVPFPVAPRACVPAVLSHRSTGMSACRPSATALALVLGPDSPREDQLYPGILGYSAEGISTPLSLLIPAFSLPDPPRVLVGRASPGRQCSPTNRTIVRVQSFGGVFEPRSFSAQGLSTSELLRTL